MILPTKHLKANRSLLVIGGDILKIVEEPQTVSRIWEQFSLDCDRTSGRAPVTYDWFILALDLLFIIGAVRFNAGRIARTAP